MSVTLVLDYALARKHRLLGALHAAGIEARLSETPLDARSCDRLLVPDGDDDDASLSRGISTGVLDAIAGHVEAGRPLLAMGLGLTLLLAGQSHPAMPPGLGVFAAGVQRFDPRITDESERPLLTPHVGSSLVVGLDRHPDVGAVVPAGEAGAWFYFKHRMCAPARVPQCEVAVCHHGVPFAGAIWRGATLAVQFLPELSGHIGIDLLRRWHRSAP